MTADRSHPVDRMLRAWTSPPAADEEQALADFRDVYADPYTVNGHAVALPSIVERARVLHAALEGLEHEVLDRFDGPGRTVLVMVQRGRHVGPLPTPIGVLPPTGLLLERPFIEVVSHADDRLQSVWVHGDDLGRLVQAGAVRLVPPAGPPPT